jgi:isoquinoline 1-oxidoreductase beta subunit
MTLSRRDLLRASAASAAGLLVSFYVPTIARAAAAALKAAPPPPAPPLPPPNAFVRIAPDDTVTVVLAHSEMGQGIWTGLAILIAEELDCDWKKVRSEHAPANTAIYGHPAMHIQMTGGSTTTWSEFDRYRNVGAMAKDMLVRAAAARWKVAPSSVHAENGVLTHGKQKLTYGEVADDAMKLAPPTKVTLKDPKHWKLIGTRVKRLDTPEKISGRAQFGIDVSFPGLRTAVVARPPAFGATLAKVDDRAAKRVKGVEQVVKTANGVAVVASSYWAAKQGRSALQLEWTPPDGGGVDSDKLLAQYKETAKQPGDVAVEVGKVADAWAAAKTQLIAEYDVPYLAHAPMEPLNATAKIDGDQVEIWAGTQFQTMDQMIAAQIAGTTPDKVQIHTMFLGGGFGRRANPTSDFVAEAVIVAKAAGVPVKVVWTREDDLHGGYYRPMFVHRAQVGLDEHGQVVSWDHTLVGQSIMAGTPFAAFAMKNGIDSTSVEGVSDSPYLDDVGARRVTLHSPTNAVTVLWWRSVGNTHTAFAMESMIDEAAHAANADPLQYRLGMLAKKPRHAAALKLAAEKAGWGTPPPAGRARGLAVHESFGSIIAECAEVSIDQGKIRVHKVTAAVDCGTVVNPLGIEAQIQSAVAFGLSAALYGKLTLRGGAVQETNFHDYPVLRFDEMPAVDVHIIASGAKMGGIGEPATAPIAPAVANAVFALTGRRLRSLPFKLDGGVA